MTPEVLESKRDVAFKYALFEFAETLYSAGYEAVEARVFTDDSLADPHVLRVTARLNGDRFGLLAVFDGSLCAMVERLDEVSAQLPTHKIASGAQSLVTI